MTNEFFIIIVICYFVFVSMLVYEIFTAKEEKELEIDTIEIIHEKKDIVSIIGSSKSKFLKPLPERLKASVNSNPNPVQVPVEEVANLFNEDEVYGGTFEYDSNNDLNREKEDIEQDDLPEMDEILSLENINVETKEVDIEKVEPTRSMCLDYNQIEDVSTRMVRGTISINDIDAIEQMMGTDIYAQLETIMNTTNLDLVREVLNNK
ncbi:MAG: hypothetical protein R3Y50_10910 [Rikenellaceae bacterium]